MASPAQLTTDMLRELEYKRWLMGSQNSVGYVPPSMGATPYLTDGTAVPPHTHALTTGGYTAANTTPYAGGHTHTIGQQANVQPGRWSETNLMQMLSSRMCWGIGGACPFPRVLPWRVTEDTVSLIVITDKDVVVIKDDANLYPSDALITQVRLLEEAL